MSVTAMEFAGKPLIREIKKRPLLYEKSAKDYANLAKRRSAWVEICQALIKDWDTWDNAEQEQAIYQANKRWHNMRNCFQRELKRQTNEEPSKRRSRRKYFYFDDMLFLIGKESDDARGKTDNDEDDKSTEDEELEKNQEEDTGFRKSKFKNYSVEHLIDAIRNEPILYDRSSSYEEGSRSEAWKRVVSAVYPSTYTNWKRKERDAAVKSLKLRWSNLRACYARELRAQIVDPKNKLHKEYLYSKHLEFLKPHMDFFGDARNNIISAKGQEYEQSDSDGLNDDQEIEYLEDIHSSDDEDEKNAAAEKNKEPSKRCNNDKTSGTDTKKFKLQQPETMMDLDPLLSHDVTLQNIDQDVNFALSLVPMLKKLSPTKKLEAQIQILNIFKNFSENVHNN